MRYAALILLVVDFRWDVNGPGRLGCACWPELTDVSGQRIVTGPGLSPPWQRCCAMTGVRVQQRQPSTPQACRRRQSPIPRSGTPSNKGGRLSCAARLFREAVQHTVKDRSSTDGGRTDSTFWLMVADGICR